MALFVLFVEVMCFDERGVVGFGFMAEEHFGNGVGECTVIIGRCIRVLQFSESGFG